MLQDTCNTGFESLPNAALQRLALSTFTPDGSFTLLFDFRSDLVDAVYRTILPFTTGLCLFCEPDNSPDTPGPRPSSPFIPNSPAESCFLLPSGEGVEQESPSLCPALCEDSFGCS
ncbi:hypothetical protein MRX96_044433 [Rhipicephalus microplus]